MTEQCESGVLSSGGDTIHWLLLNEHAPADVLPPQSMPDYLSAAEWSFYAALKTDKRRRDWLLGRLAAKRLLAGVIGESSGQSIAHNQIVILPHADGWPTITVPGGAVPAISISHSHGWAFCAAVDKASYPLGADIEYVEPRSAGFVEDYFTPIEREYLAVTPLEQRTVLTNAIWSGKEAALKAIRRGLAEDTRVVSCLPHPLMADDPEWLPMRLIWHTAPAAPNRPPLSGRWRMVDEFVLTLACATESG